jgi:flavin-binding protein dodecin
MKMAKNHWKEGWKRPRRAVTNPGETIFDYTNRLFDEGKLIYDDQTGDLIVNYDFTRRDGKRESPKIVRTLDRKGYYRLNINIDGCKNFLTVHRVVYAFKRNLSEFPKGLVINHKNGIKTDNRMQNLELVTYKENTQHALNNGLKRRRTTCKLDWNKVREIRSLIADGSKQHWKIAEEYGVVKSTIDRIAQNVLWRDDEWYEKHGKKRK